MIILLDIDGVLVKGNSWDKLNILDDGFPEFNIKSVIALQKIIDATNGVIILTTSHKSRYTISQWKEIFILRDIKINTIDKLPDNINNISRKEEIEKWIADENVNIKNCVIIDDDKSLNDFSKVFKDKFVLICTSIGLTNEDAYKAIKILNENN